jgi:hypothetical protein
MKITNDSELATAIQEADVMIQAIHDYAARDFKKPCKLRFPRGYVRTAESARQRLAFLPAGPLKDNIAYTLILADTINWLLVRTDVYGTIREQLIKLVLFLFGALVESITKVYLKGKCGRNRNYKYRTAYLVEQNIIGQELKGDLDWLWDMRNNMHLFLVDDSEYSSPHYTTANHNRAFKAFRGLVKSLDADKPAVRKFITL